VVGEAATAELAVAMIRRLAVDVALLDIRLFSGNGVQACREIRSTCPQTACLMLTAHTDEKAFLASIMAGAAGYVPKMGVGDELVEAVHAAAAGQKLLSAERAWQALEELNSLAIASADRLSTQDQQVLTLIEEGMTDREIASQLSVPEQSVRESVSSLLTTIGV
jgi:DNA-binding NarL/FixJ family response regulator